MICNDNIIVKKEKVADEELEAPKEKKISGGLTGSDGKRYPLITDTEQTTDPGPIAESSRRESGRQLQKKAEMGGVSGVSCLNTEMKKMTQGKIDKGQ